MNQMKLRSRSVYTVIILFLLMMAVQILMLNNFFQNLNTDSQAINDLSRVRGSIQRYTKLELSGISMEGMPLEAQIGKLISRHLELHGKESQRKDASYYVELEALNAKWAELKFLVQKHRVSPDSELRKSILTKSEECWILADTYVAGQQHVFGRTVDYIKYVTITFGINLFVIALVLFLYKRFVLNTMASSAINDSLTEIFNKGYFDEYLEYEIARALRKETSFSLIMFDIDHFKKVNDTYGHHRGDYALKTLAAVVRKCKRSSDVLARIGGEEFIILLPDTGITYAVELAERIRKSVEVYSFEEIGKMTVSLGVTEFLQTDNKDSILKRVDSAMYLAKDKGRNRWESIGNEEANE